MGGYAVQIDPTTRTMYPPDVIVRLMQEEVIETPILEEQDIDDRSKADWLTKTIALVQITWFLTQLLARAIQKLPVSTLELYTLSIVICSIFTYAYNWHKPFDVQRPVVLRPIVTEYDWPEKTKRIGFTDESGGETGAAYGFMVFGVFLLFSACHLIGWNFEFPTKTEQWLWRVGSVLCCVLPFSVMFMGQASNKGLMYGVGAPGMTLYVIVRIALFVEIFTGLRAAPPGVYQTPRWTDYFPSFGN